MSRAPLRILHVVPYYDDAWAYGGIPRVATALTRGLARRGHGVSVCTTDACDAHARTAVSTGTSHGVHVQVFANLSNRLAYHLQCFTPLGLRRHLRQHAGSFDVAHLHACHNFASTIAAAALGHAGVPFVVSPNGTARPIERRILAKRFFAATVGRRLLTRSARVLAVTEAERRDLVGLGVAHERIAVVPNPLEEAPGTGDAQRFRRAHALGTAPLVLFLGKLTPRKGIGDLITAYAALRRPATTLVIAGNDMGAGTAADALVSRLRLDGRVVRTGLLTGVERQDALSAAEVVVYPSRDEIFGLVPLEALLCGRPVVVCGDSGCGEVIRSVGGGLVVPPSDPPALAQAIAAILDDGPRWRRLAREAGDRARARFGTDVVCALLERVYLDVLDGDGCHAFPRSA
ncbi:MAG: glycosyltransferase [Acidobacteriota bacterium]